MVNILEKHNNEQNLNYKYLEKNNIILFNLINSLNIYLLEFIYLL